MTSSLPQRLGLSKREAAPEDFPPSKAARHGDHAEEQGVETLLDDTASAEPHQKVPRTSPQGSPPSASGSLYPPHFAGTIQQMLDVGEIDDEVWEDDVADYIEPGDMVINVGDDDYTPAAEGKPPQVTAAELSSLDEAAGYEQINRLLEMAALQEPTHEDLEEGVVLSTQRVMDWRFREQRWRRRCRFVAGEFKGFDKGSASTFAPTLEQG